MPIVSASVALVSRTTMHAAATLCLSVIRLSPTGNGLTWDGPNGNGEVSFHSAKAEVVLELLRRKYGAVQQNKNGEHHLYVSQADKLINALLPYVQEEELPGWDELSQHSNDTARKRLVPEEVFPKDFNEKLTSALLELEERHLRLPSSVSASLLSPPVYVEQVCPYDLSGLTTLRQRERFDYVYANRPTVQAIRTNLKIAPATWREYVRSTLNLRLSDCLIVHNQADSVWEVIPSVMNS